MCSYIRTIILNMQEQKEKLQWALGKAIKKYRTGYSINRLSNEIGLSKSVWSDLERGKKDVQFTTFWRIAEALNISPIVLIKDIERELGKEFSFIEDNNIKKMY